jgi:class I fructose-bisphosphate aldolase
MKITKKVEEILSHYASENPGVKANLYKMLMTGKLAGTGKMVILPVDQGFEHGPERSFGMNPKAFDPHYHFKLAIDAELNAFAAPLGLLSCGASEFAGQIPLILKMNSNNLLMSEDMNTNQAITASVDDAVRLGCSAIGFTIYPGSDFSFEMYEEISAMIEEAKGKGLPTVIWSYARGGNLPKEHETSVDVISYGAHIACLLGAHIVKVKPPKATVFDKKTGDLYTKNGITYNTLSKRIELVRKACFDGKRIVIFSGGEAKDDKSVIEEIKHINQGGGFGSIIGRNAFQRSREDALNLLSAVISVYSDK